MPKMPQSTDREAIQIRLNAEAVLKYHKSLHPDYKGDYLKELEEEFTQYFAENGMEPHPRYGYLSKGNMSFKEADSIAKAFAKKYAWLGKCKGVAAFNITEVKGYMDFTDFFDESCDEQSK